MFQQLRIIDTSECTGRAMNALYDLSEAMNTDGKCCGRFTQEKRLKPYFRSYGNVKITSHIIKMLIISITHVGPNRGTSDKILRQILR